jgi:hypothetical protein
MADSNERVKPNDTEADEGGMSEAEIDQNLKDTFPASDPPSWTLGTNHGAESHNESKDKPSDASKDSEAE